MTQRLPISTAPQDGRAVFVGDANGNIARVRWGEGMWIYDVPADGAVEQIDFMPTHWASSPHYFLGELVITAAGQGVGRPRP